MSGIRDRQIDWTSAVHFINIDSIYTNVESINLLHLRFVRKLLLLHGRRGGSSNNFGKLCSQLERFAGGVQQMLGESRNKKKRISIDEQQSEKCQSTVISKKRERNKICVNVLLFAPLASPSLTRAPLSDAIPTWVPRPEIVNGNVLLGVRLS